MSARDTASTGPYKYAHKLFEPRPYGGVVEREPLLSRLFGVDAPRVVVAQGPAGHGKTTLLQQALARCRAQGQVVGWLTADASDNDLRRLAMHLHVLVSSMEDSVARRVAGPAPRAPLEAGGSRADGLIARLMALEQPAVMFLDDFHALEHRSVLAFFRDLIEHLPDSVRVFIGSRAIPDIGLARLVVNQQALVLRADDLRFSPAEVRQFFSAAQDLALVDEECSAIHHRTEGWPAAVHLFRLSLASPSVRRSLAGGAEPPPRDLADYLADNVLALQSQDVQQFLLHSSPLTRLNAGLCDEVLGREDSQAMLQQLERSGLFLRSLDAEGEWFGYHAMFAAFLQAQLRAEDPQHLQSIHQRAATWFLRHGLHEAAMGHAVASGDYALAAEVLDAWSSRLIALGHLVTVENAYELLPLDEVARRPELVVKVAWALCFLRRHQKLRPVWPLLSQLPGTRLGQTRPDVVRAMLAMLSDDAAASSEIIDRVDLEGHDVDDFQAFELAAGANLRGYLAMLRGEPEAAREWLALARAYGERAKAGFSLGYSISASCLNLIVQGDLAEAVTRLRQATSEPWMRLDESVSSAAIAACQVHALYESGDLAAAATRFEAARDAIARFALLDFTAVAFVAMSRIHDLRGQPTQALEVLDQAETIGHTSLWPRLVRIVAWERVRRLLIRGDLDRAQAAASRIGPGEQALPDGWLSYDDAEGDLVNAARLDIHRGRATQALAELEPACELARRQGRVRRQVRLRVLMALAEQSLARANAAQAHLQVALEAAMPGGLLRCILDEGEGVVRLLRDRIAQGGRDHGTRLAFVERLLEASGLGQPDERGAAFQALEPLTEREKRILVLLTDGSSNEDIAGQLFVSRNTVKFHLKNIYSKLAVNSRLQAINAARAMGLVR